MFLRTEETFEKRAVTEIAYVRQGYGLRIRTPGPDYF